MNSDKTPRFSESMMRIKELTDYKDKDCFVDYLNGVNTIRAYYPWSKKTYDETNIANVYLILSSGTAFGFIECVYKNLEIWSDSLIQIYLEEIHVAPSMQSNGVGKSVLRHLLKKGIPIEMVVANENTKMLSLVSKFKYENKYITENTRTVIIRP